MFFLVLIPPVYNYILFNELSRMLLLSPKDQWFEILAVAVPDLDAGGQIRLLLPLAKRRKMSIRLDKCSFVGRHSGGQLREHLRRLTVSQQKDEHVRIISTLFPKFDNFYDMVHDVLFHSSEPGAVSQGHYTQFITPVGATLWPHLTHNLYLDVQSR